MLVNLLLVNQQNETVDVTLGRYLCFDKNLAVQNMSFKLSISTHDILIFKNVD